MFNLGFNGQFGGGFLQSSGGGIAQAPAGSITYAINWARQRPRDDSQRRDRYGALDSWGLAFPTSPEGPVWFHSGKSHARRNS